MKALGFFENGDLSKMQLFETDIPKPKAGEVLIQLKASAFNHLDIWVRKGLPGIHLNLPHISGSDGAGIVAELGENVHSVKAGDRVAIDPGICEVEDEFTARGERSVSPDFAILGEHLSGTHTEYVVVPEKNLLKIPENISFELAAASGLVCMTAWRMLINRGNLKVGEMVLIVGAGGGVNSVAIQIAKLAGCEVHTITSSEEKMQKAKSLGADVVLNYKTESNWVEQLYKLTNKVGYDVVVDNVGKATLQTSMRLVKRGGRIVIVGNTRGQFVELDIRYLFGKQISLIGSTMGSHDDYLRVMQLVFAGKIKPPIHTILPLPQGIEAMRLMEEGEQFGKIVLSR
ncbi:MAG: zinc-binding dehydrogenase [Gammaproteobacteria bacterium]